MTLGLFLHPRAQLELREAADWYDSRQPGLGDELMAAISDQVEVIRSDPARFPIVHHDIRQSLVKRFPFAIYFRVQPDQIFVLSVFHASRDPDSLRERFGES